MRRRGILRHRHEGVAGAAGSRECNEKDLSNRFVCALHQRGHGRRVEPRLAAADRVRRREPYDCRRVLHRRHEGRIKRRLRIQVAKPRRGRAPDGRVRIAQRAGHDRRQHRRVQPTGVKRRANDNHADGRRRILLKQPEAARTLAQDAHRRPGSDELNAACALSNDFDDGDESRSRVDGVHSRSYERLEQHIVVVRPQQLHQSRRHAFESSAPATVKAATDRGPPGPKRRRCDGEGQQQIDDDDDREQCHDGASQRRRLEACANGSSDGSNPR
jgi:hypothetical protein